jgi:uncharacterized protein YcnI
MKHLTKFIIFITSFILLGQVAAAHVIVKPTSVLTGAIETFDVSVPNEKDVPITMIKVLIPDNVQAVTPTAKAGWTITEDKDGSGETAKVRSISWSQGSLPASLRDDFTFTAKAPDNAVDLQWKAYQTYQDGTVVAWDKDPSTIKPGEEGTPFSVTKVTVQTTETSSLHVTNKTTDSTARTLALSALAISLFILAFTTRQKQPRK